MKRLMLFMSFFSLQNIYSIEVYQCNITLKKSVERRVAPWTKSIFLSPEFFNRVTFSKTNLDLTFSSTTLELNGLVNEQPNHILSGKITDGYFKSAYGEGVVQCQQKLELSYLLQFLPWKQFFSLDKVINGKGIQNDIIPNSSGFSNYCFIGSILATKKAVDEALQTKGIVLNKDEINYTLQAIKCIRSTGEFDSFECLEEAKYTFNANLKRCSFEIESNYP